MNLETAKENLFKMKNLTYLEAIENKMELIKNKNKIKINVEKIRIVKNGNNYYLKYEIEEIDNYKITQAEKGM